MRQTLNYLAFDLGAESGRAILGEFDGERVQLSQMHRFLNTPVRVPVCAPGSAVPGDALHWDILRLWAEIKEGIAQAVHKQQKQLAGMGIDTWGVDFGLLDRQGNLLGSPYHYRDNRTDGMMEEAFRTVPRERIFAATGIQFLQLNTLYQLLAMVRSGAPALELATTYLGIPDLLNYWLSGRAACEFSHATTTQCYDPRQETWAWPMLQALGIPTRIFGEVVPAGTVIGNLLPEVAAETGGAGVPVIAPASHDTGSAVAAVPATEADFVWLSCGTWSIMGTESPVPIINDLSLKYNFTNEGGVCNTFRFCKNIIGLWIVQECRRTWLARGEEHSYAELTEMAARAKPHVAVIDPDHGDFLKPGDMPSRVAAFCRRTGQPVPEDKGALVRCVLESIALKYRQVLESLEEIYGHPLGTIHMVGGGTQNRLLCQLTADASGHPVVAGPVEATATGNLLVQALALGHVGSLADMRTVVRNSFDLIPYEPSKRDGWDEAYAKLKQIMAD